MSDQAPSSSQHAFPLSDTSYTIAVLGATGMVGRQLIKILEERHFPVRKLIPLASERSVGSNIQFRGRDIPVELAEPNAFEGVDIVLASAGGSISEKLVPEAVKRGATVIDNTSFFRMTEDIPLVVAGVNDQAIKTHQGIIANPNCSTAQLMPVLNALKLAAGLKKVSVSTYQSVSGSGKAGMEELKTTSLNPDKALDNDIFSRPIAFNLIPHIDSFIEEGEFSGYTKEEVKLIRETRKILELPNLKVTATAVRVPVMIGHSEAVTVELARSLPPRKAIKALSETPNIVVAEEDNDYHTPLETAGTDPVYVSRIRRDNTNPSLGLHMWVVADNLRIGAALNAVRLAELLVEYRCVKPLPTHAKPAEDEAPPVEQIEFIPKPAPKPIITAALPKKNVVKLGKSDLPVDAKVGSARVKPEVLDENGEPVPEEPPKFESFKKKRTEKYDTTAEPTKEEQATGVWNKNPGRDGTTVSSYPRAKPELETPVTDAKPAIANPSFSEAPNETAKEAVKETTKVPPIASAPMEQVAPPAASKPVERLSDDERPDAEPLIGPSASDLAEIEQESTVETL